MQDQLFGIFSLYLKITASGYSQKVTIHVNLPEKMPSRMAPYFI